MKKGRHGDYERTVTFPVWSGYKVHIIFTDDIGRSRKARYGEYGLSEDAKALHSSTSHGHSHIFYLLGDCPTGVLAHEAWHAIRCMLVDFGGVDVMENEVTAYHLGYLVQKIADFRNALIDTKVYKEK